MLSMNLLYQRERKGASLTRRRGGGFLLHHILGEGGQRDANSSSQGSPYLARPITETDFHSSVFLAFFGSEGKEGGGSGDRA